MKPLRTDRLIYLRVLGPLVLVTAILMLVSIASFHYQAASRTYVGGRAAWYNSVNQSLDLLRERAYGRQPQGSCDAVDGLMAVPLGNSAARREMDKPEPNFTAVRQALLRGGNRPEDVGGIIRMYRVIHDLPAVQPVMGVWRDGDMLLDRLQAVSRKICVPDSHLADGAQANLREIDVLSAGLVDVENRFAKVLDAVSHNVRNTLTATVLVLGFLLAGGGGWFVVRTIRAQIKQRDQLLEANVRWDMAADAANIGVFVWHTNDDTVELDERARRIRGFDNDSRTTFTLADILHPAPTSDQVFIENQSAQSLPEGERRRTRFRLQLADGSARHIETTAMMQARTAQRPSRMFGVVRDVTDEMLITQLRIEKETAHHSARAHTEFLSRVSHELRTPLNSILGLAQLLEMDTANPLTTEQRKRLELMQQSGWHLLQLVDNVLDISRLDSGSPGVANSLTDPRVAMLAALQIVEPERQAYGVILSNQLPTQFHQVHADPDRLQQVFVSLLSNACKFNARGGQLTLSYRVEPEFIGVTIADEGPGMNPEKLTQLFQPFNRLKPPSDVPGTGLGLVVAKLLIEQMGGTLEVASKPGQGSRFTVRLRKA